jgi:aryl-alcohol dehydrogenase-like predicted oxidoreductase
VTAPPLDRHPLGSTGLTITRIGLGLAALGRPAYITLGRPDDLGGDRSIDAMERRCHAMLDAAYDAGVRYVDAARSYGRAEAFLASWLDARDLQDGAPTIGSKWGYTYTGDWRLDAPLHEAKDLSIDALCRQLAESRACLGRRLQLYQIHSATLESGVLQDQRVLEELVRLRSEGLAIGLTVTGPEQAETIRRALEVHVRGVNPFQSIQATWNLLEPSAGSALADAHAQGWGVIVKEGLANGRLTGRQDDESIEPLTRQAKALGTTVDAIALSAALSQPWADVVLSGAVTSAQLRSNLDALTASPTTIDWSPLAEPADEYWARRKKAAWT